MGGSHLPLAKGQGLSLPLHRQPPVVPSPVPGVPRPPARASLPGCWGDGTPSQMSSQSPPCQPSPEGPTSPCSSQGCAFPAPPPPRAPAPWSLICLLLLLRPPSPSYMRVTSRVKCSGVLLALGCLQPFKPFTGCWRGFRGRWRYTCSCNTPVATGRPLPPPARSFPGTPLRALLWPWGPSSPHTTLSREREVVSLTEPLTTCHLCPTGILVTVHEKGAPITTTAPQSGDGDGLHLSWRAGAVLEPRSV